MAACGREQSETAIYTINVATDVITKTLPEYQEESSHILSPVVKDKVLQLSHIILDLVLK